MKKRTYRSEREKAKVALEAVRNDETLSQIASRHKVNSTQVSKWRSILLSQAYRLFERSNSPSKTESNEELISSLYEQIGKLKVENDYLKKKINY